jgi:hypothetical protein
MIDGLLSRALLTLGAVICLQGFACAQTSTTATTSSSSSSGTTPSMGSYTQDDTILNSVSNSNTTTTFKIQSLSSGSSSTSGNKIATPSGVSSNTVTTAILPYLIQLFALFRFMALVWLLLLTVVIGMNFALQQGDVKDLIHGFMGASIVIGAQVFAGIFIGILPTAST